MALKLTKGDMATLGVIVDDLRGAQGKLEDAINVANAAIRDLNDQLDQAFADYNGVIDTSNDLMDEIRSRLRDEWDNRSETWQQSDRGIDAEGWVSQFEEITFSQVDSHVIDEVPMPEDAEDIASQVEDLPMEWE